MNKLDDILDGLIRRTSDGKLKWNRTPEANQFVTAVDALAVIVRRWDFSHALHAPPEAAFELEIIDEKGSSIETLRTRSKQATTGQEQKLSDLHDLARLSALNVQETLDKLAKALEA